MKTLIGLLLGILIYRVFFHTPYKHGFDVIKDFTKDEQDTILSLLPKKVRPTWAESFIGNRNYDGLKFIHGTCGRNFLSNLAHPLEIFEHPMGPFSKWYDSKNDMYLADGPISPERDNFSLPGFHIITASIANKDKEEYTDRNGVYERVNRYGNYFIYKPHTCQHCGRPIRKEETEVHKSHYRHNEDPITTGSPLSMQRYCGECQKKFRESEMYYTFFIDPLTMELVTSKDNKEEFTKYMRRCTRLFYKESALELRGVGNLIEDELVEAETYDTIIDYVVNADNSPMYFRCLGLK